MIDQEKINITILILDDDREEHILIEDVLRDAGLTNYKLHVNWKEFQNALTGSIDVCIIDHFLAEKTGLQILKMVKEKNKDSFAIAYTGLPDDAQTSAIKTDYINTGVALRWVNKNENGYLDLLSTFLHEGLETAIWRVDMLNKLNKIEQEAKAKPELNDNK